MKKIIYSDLAPAPIGPYSQAVRFGNTLYVSGQIPFDQSKEEMVSESIEKETRQVMINLGHVLEAGDLSYADVLKCSIFVSDMGDFAKINDVYGEYFKENPPARETVEVSQLPKGVNVEISCIAGYKD